MAAFGGLLGALPLETALALTRRDSGPSAIGAPRIALVVGNANYAKAVPLGNPVNDARGMADALKAAGFSVELLLDAQRAQMTQAIEAFVARLGRERAVGLFYFAGHGMQFSWRNYLLPVDASIGGMEAVTASAVDVNALIEGIARAANPMNVIILDACRDNPFGRDFRVPQRGLSQLDAPPGTLLAYATAPGNVAIDGDGTNGLYTEALLREIPAPEARIEDVFKRVRLAVRRRSRGLQIPWESTSLEEDFWFFPPAQLKKLSDDEKERLFQDELALWEKVQKAAAPGPLEDYLRRYPNGKFCELAQLQLDRVLARQGEKKLLAASQEGNPFTKGSAEADTNFAVGDSYTNRSSDLFTGIEQSTHTMTVARITESEVIFSNGVVTDLLGNVRETHRGGRFSSRQQYPLEYVVGKRWTTRFESTNRQGATGTSVLDLHIAARERITVPAGTFDAFRIEGHGFTTGLPVGVVEMRPRWWMAPDQVRQPIRAEDHRTAKRGTRILVAQRTDLVSFKQR